MSSEAVKVSGHGPAVSMQVAWRGRAAAARWVSGSGGVWPLALHPHCNCDVSVRDTRRQGSRTQLCSDVVWTGT